MNLLLIISLHKDPLHIPYTLINTLESELPGCKIFQLDTFSSSELMLTAREAIQLAQKCLVYVQTQSPDVSPGKLLQLFKIIVSHDKPLCWLEQGENSLKIFKRMYKGEIKQIGDAAELIEEAKRFYH
jgi:hypothetical protein